MFGDGDKIKALEAEVVRLNQWISYLKGAEPVQLETRTNQARAELAGLNAQIQSAQQWLRYYQDGAAAAQALIVQTQEVALLQEVGIYEYSHPLTDAVAYKSRVAQLQDRIKAMARGNGAVLASTTWQVGGSMKAGSAMVRDLSKLMLRAYNAEADNCVRTLKPYALQSAKDRLSKARDTIARLGNVLSIQISPPYHALRLEELDLTADYLAKKEEEKERQREERERAREEAAAQAEFEREKDRLRREHDKYTAALARMTASGDTAKAAELQAKLEEVTGQIASVEARQANLRVGFVYVISNVGAFGQRVVKIGLTRRLDPMDRVRELGDASVPFRYDVHALIFSGDAVGLETKLHQAFATQRVNMINARREFFYASPVEVRDMLATMGSEYLLEFVDEPEALEWRASEKARRPPEAAAASQPAPWSSLATP